MIRSFFDSYGVPALFVLFVLLFILEGKFELRKRMLSRWKRIFINFMVSIPAFALLRVLFLPVMVWLAYKNQSLHFGLNYLYQLPAWLEGAIAFLILDYGNYVWHILNHRVPLLWRFHLVHHTDRDLDLTTAFRFHFGEMIGSVFFRGTITFLSGATPLAVLVYEIFFEAATQFHHSNTRLPFRFEKIMSKIFVTPRMHGIHHSDVEGELDSNYSVVFSVWDRLHKSLRLNIEQKEVVVGIPGYGDARELTVLYLLKLPFTKLRPLLLKPKRDEKSVGEDQSRMKMKP
jgi:sterol desaturase/sphingolipid hydroxylase (fatty acid hydroxylase superfamily)